jgi:Ala-tRNA(Pro) deacylase
MRIDQVLSNRQIPFELLHHRPAYTANRVAQVLHIPGKDVAKTVLLRAGRGYVLAVLPATHRLDVDRVRQELREDFVEMAGEPEMDDLFPDCERGAIPPFGSMYHLPTIVDESLAQDDEIVFEAQTHEDAIRMSFRDYDAVEHPVKGHFARHI